jgi:PAS domain S-box-containing protein
VELSFWSLTLTPVLALMSYALLVFTVLRRAVASRLQRAFALYLAVMGVWSFGSALMRLDPAHILSWNRVSTGAGIVIPLAFYLFILTFLEEKPGIWLWLGIVAQIALQGANMAGHMVTDVQLLEGGLISFSTGLGGYVSAIYGFFYYFLSLRSLARAYSQTSEAVLRNRIRYLVISVFLVVLGGATNVVADLGAFPLDHAANLLNALLLTYAVLRYRLVDIALVFRKGLLYSIPTAIIGVSYFLIISLAANLFHAFAGPQIFLLSLVVAVIAAVIAQPLRDRAQLWIDRAFFREKYDASLMLQRLSRTVASVLDLRRLTNLILDEVTSTMHIERAAFFLKEEKSRDFRMMAQRGLDPSVEARLRSDHPIVNWLSNHERALTENELDMLPQFKALWGREREDLDRMGTELFIPLKAKGELVGVLTIGPKLSGESYAEDDQLTLTTLANQTATALENARLHEETRRRNRELTLLNRIIAASATGHDLELILQTICHAVSSAFGVSQTFAVLLNEERTEALLVAQDASPMLSLQTSLFYPAQVQVERRASSPSTLVSVKDNPLFRHLLEAKTPLIVDEVRSDLHLFAIFDLMRQGRIAALLALPLFVGDQVVGGLCLESTRPRTFTADELDLAYRVTEQVSGAVARVRLAETQQRLSTAVEQAAEAVMITEVDGIILYVNPAFEQMSGYSRAEVIGQNPRLLKSGRQDEAFYRHLWQTITTGAVWQGRLINKKKDGTLYTGDTTITPVRGQAGEIFNFVATMRDVTREVQLEQQFYQAQKMEALGRFAGGIAHDFNNLLTIIQLTTRFLQRRVDPQDDLWEHVQRIHDTGERAAMLTRQLLSFSRREVVEPRVVDLNQMVDDLSGMLERIIGEDVELQVTLSEGLWPIKIDPSQMEQVVANLVVNACDAMPQGGSLRIETANVVLDEAYVARHVDAQIGEHVMLTVSDTGVGMNDEVKAHLFEPFFTTKERGQGTGLGLSIVFGIVKQAEGHIGVQSDMGQGTTFHIYLPRSLEKNAELPTRATYVGDVEGAETVLLVEDEAEVRELTARTLRMQGYHVLAVCNGAEALQTGRKYDGPIHLLLTDVVMPEMDGAELVKQLQPERLEMRVLYMSGYADRPLVKQVTSDPDIAFLPKPFTVEALTQKVRAVLDDSI